VSKEVVTVKAVEAVEDVAVLVVAVVEEDMDATDHLVVKVAVDMTATTEGIAFYPSHQFSVSQLPVVDLSS
jgi:hypothetical protein